ncbi:hypothetical protein [Mycolicibacterium sp. YH-1]|uniref:hypothetical protein n=1 Tax=Mycolicibacterium sp. YH-1 TaxID=2908837 RepID=UPI001F4BFEC8|nr:hypothetical protein [Mycolicibacterium sp. YH-1]UNB55478.1 hypothetical protein L0M16_14895 [Mycolicibacterium sp. YH-1]
MASRISAGKRLVRTLNKSLRDGTEWTETELLTLDLIEAAADRMAVLKALFVAEVSKPTRSTRRITEVSAEIRQTEASIQKWIAVLDPYMQKQPRSRQHQQAAWSRWHGAS